MKQLLLFVLTLLPVTASADESGKCGANTYYSYDSATHTLTIYGEGRIDGRDFAEDLRPWRFYESDIHTVIIESGVTSVGIYSFVGCSNLASVAIPSSVKCIEDCAFRGCSGLTTMTIPYGVTSIGNDDWGGAFQACTGLTSITIPSSVTDIGDETFSGCSSLSTVISEIAEPFVIDKLVFDGIPSNAKLIVPKGTTEKYKSTEGWNRFANIVEEFGIGDVVESNGIYYRIGENNTASVTSGKTKYSGEVVIPSKVTFWGTTYTVTSIDFEAFSGCTSLTSITIPSSVITIRSGVFEHCTSLTSMKVENGNPKYDSRDNCNAIIETSSNKLISGCKNTVIPNSVTDIGSGAFRGLTNLTSINIPNSVVHIESYAFQECSGLVSVDIPNSVTAIGEFAFNKCSNLISISIPNSVHSIGRETFNWTAWYDKQPEGLVHAGNVLYKYKGEMPANTHISIKEGILGIAGGAFDHCSGLTSVEIPNSVTNIGGCAFMVCSGLTTVTIPNSVTFIGSSAFCGCRNLTSIAIPSKVTIIEDLAFAACDNMTSVTIPESVTFIDELAFAYCTSLSSVTIPKRVKSIKQLAFADCSSLTSIISDIEDPFKIDESVFDGTSSNAKLIVPKGTKEKYQYTKGWNKFSNIVEVGGIGYVFEADGIYYMIGENNTVSVSHGNTKYFGDIVIPNQVKYSGTTYSVTRIEDHAFYECCDLTSIKIPNSVTRIGSAAFHGCNLTSVVIGKNVTGMGSEAFKNNSNLTSVVCNSNSVAIGSSFFEECYNLKYICVTSDEYPGSFLGTMKCQCIMPQSVFDGGVPEDITNYVTYSAAPKFITVKSTTATTATLELTPIDLTGGSTGGTPYEVTIFGLKPGSFVKGFWKDGASDQGLASIPTVTTKNLVMNVQPAKPTSKIKARLLATVNELDDDTHFGFEWLRYDAPDNMTPNKVSAPLYDGQIVGTLNNLNPDVYYKYRPYYKSEDGSLFYGEWESFITGDADVFFEPETHTKDVVEVSSVSAELAGVWIEGTEDIDEKGFEYWAVPGGNTRAAGRDVKKVIVSGKKTSVVVEDLAVGTVYGYRSYMKTVSGITYGEEKTFMTINVGDVNGDGNVDFTDVNLVVSHIMGNTPIGFNMDAADVNNDGKVNAADIVLINGMIKK